MLSAYGVRCIGYSVMRLSTGCCGVDGGTKKTEGDGGWQSGRGKGAGRHVMKGCVGSASRLMRAQPRHWQWRRLRLGRRSRCTCAEVYGQEHLAGPGDPGKCPEPGGREECPLGLAVLRLARSRSRTIDEMRSFPLLSQISTPGAAPACDATPGQTPPRPGPCSASPDKLSCPYLSACWSRSRGTAREGRRGALTY